MVGQDLPPDGQPGAADLIHFFRTFLVPFVTSTSALIAIVHNDGPAGSGVTLPFGCAAEVANHIARA